MNPRNQLAHQLRAEARLAQNAATFSTPEEVYDKLAGEYDNTYVRPIDLAENELIRRLCRWSLPLPGHKVVDLGCGTGLLLDIYPWWDPTDYVGVDVSGSMLQEARKKHPKATFVQSTAKDYLSDQPDNSIELITSLFAFQYFDQANVAWIIHRKLTYTGKMFIITCGRRYRFRKSYIVNKNGYRIKQDLLPTKTLQLLFPHASIRGFNHIAEHLQFLGTRRLFELLLLEAEKAMVSPHNQTETHV